MSLGPLLACDDPGFGPGLPLGAGVDEPEATDDEGMGLEAAELRSLSFCSFSDDSLSVTLTAEVFMVCGVGGRDYDLCTVAFFFFFPCPFFPSPGLHVILPWLAQRRLL